MIETFQFNLIERDIDFLQFFLNRLIADVLVEKPFSLTETISLSERYTPWVVCSTDGRRVGGNNKLIFAHAENDGLPFLTPIIISGSRCKESPNHRYRKSHEGPAEPPIEPVAAGGGVLAVTSVIVGVKIADQVGQHFGVCL
jgi:hypothetical protein